MHSVASWSLVHEENGTMKSVLAVLIEVSEIKAHLPAAAAFARAHDAHLDVLAIGLDATPVSYGEFGATVAIIRDGIARAEKQATELAEAARAQLAAEGTDLRWAVDTQIVQGGGLIDVVGRSARFADIVIQPQPYGEGRSLYAESVVECALFDGRAPVLVLPETGLGAAANPERVVIAWNQSPQAMAAVRAALPLLRKAKSVSIAVVDPRVHDPERADPGGRLCQMLARHGVHADVAVLARTMPRVTDVLHRHLADHAADMLVMGAYGHSRLREAIFGGVTRDILEMCPAPVLMAH
jgi:nucleotide-binding universal stress UspA family protein